MDAIELFEKQFAGAARVVNSKIDFAKALPMINQYRKTMPAGSVKSIWLNDEVIKLIKSITAFNLSGMRVYFATRTDEDPNAGEFTIILAPTFNTPMSGRTDVGYFDYGDPCPPAGNCDGDIGN